jgi:hypothetical protein
LHTHVSATLIAADVRHRVRRILATYAAADDRIKWPITRVCGHEHFRPFAEPLRWTGVMLKAVRTKDLPPLDRAGFGKHNPPVTQTYGRLPPRCLNCGSKRMSAARCVCNTVTMQSRSSG